MQNSADILKQVKTTIEHSTRFDRQAWPISMSFHQGTLMLNGDLPQLAAKRRMLNAAASVDGVTRIVDHLRVGHLNGHGGSALRDAVCNLLAQQIDFRNCSLHTLTNGRAEVVRNAGPEASGLIMISAADGVVTLSGIVISLSHKRLAGMIAWWAGGCRDVVNELEVVPGEDDNDDEIVDALRLAFEVDPCVHADRIAITVRDRVVTLDGVVTSAGERDRAEMDAWSMYAVTGVVNRIRVH